MALVAGLSYILAGHLNGSRLILITQRPGQLTCHRELNELMSVYYRARLY